MHKPIPFAELTVRLVVRPEHECWDLRVVVDGVVIKSRRVETVTPLDHSHARAIFDAVEREIDSWLF